MKSDYDCDMIRLSAKNTAKGKEELQCLTQSTAWSRCTSLITEKSMRCPTYGRAGRLRTQDNWVDLFHAVPSDELYTI